MSQSLGSDRTNSQPLSTTSARLVAVKLKSANKNIFRALLSLASANLLQRVFGLINLAVVAHQIGINQSMDAYNVSVLLPITIATILGGSLESSVIPVYSRLRTKGAKEQSSRLFSTLLNFLVILTIVITGLSLVFKNPLLAITAPGSSQSILKLAASMAIYTFPVLVLMTLNSFMECLLNADGKFGWPAYAGLLVPLTTVIFIFLGDHQQGIMMYAFGTLTGNILQLIVIVYRAHTGGIVYRPVMDLKMPELKPILAYASPSLFGAVISMISPLFDQFFSSYQPAGTISAFNIALKFNGVPTGVIFSAVGRAALPYLASQAAIKDMKAFKGTLRLYIWVISIVTFIVTIVMIGLSYAAMVFHVHFGSTNAEQVTETAVLLIGLSIGLIPTAVGFILSKAFNALGKPTVLVAVSTFSVFANAGFDAFFGHFWGGFGIAFATSLYYVCTMVILAVTLTRSIGNLELFSPPKELLDVLWKFGMGSYIERFEIWRDDNMPLGLTHEFRKQIFQVLFALVIFAGGVAGAAFVPNFYRYAFGIVVIFALLRYPYILLIGWACINVFIGSALPLFNGANLLSGLTLPTFLLLFYLPTKYAFKRMLALGLLCLYFIWILLSAGISPMTPYEFTVTWSTLMDFLGASVLVILLINTRKKLINIIDLMIAPAIFIAFYGFFGFAIKQHGVIDPTTGLFRISSIFYDTPPTLGLYLSILIPVTIYRLFTLKGFWKITGGALVLIILMVAVGLTLNRGTYIALGLMFAVMVLFMPSAKIRGIMISSSAAIGGLVVLIASAANVPIFARFSNSDIGSLNGRTALWQALLDHFDPAQLMGYGHNSSQVLLENLKVGFGGNVIATAAHNIYLEAMFEHGIIGLVLLLTIFVILGVTLIIKWFQGDYDRRLLIAMALGCFASIALQGYESNDIWNQGVGIYFFMFMAMPFAVCWDKKDKLAEDGEKIDEIETQEVGVIPDSEKGNFVRA
jgi:putative peptidoglycan lipid II flippase